MAALDTVTIADDGTYVVAPSGSDTTKIIYTISQKHVLIKPPTDTTNGRKITLQFVSLTSDSHVTLDRYAFGCIDEIETIPVTLVDGNLLTVDIEYISGSGAVQHPQWYITRYANCRGRRQHPFGPLELQSISIVSNSPAFVASDDGAAVLADVQFGGGGIKATDDATMILAFDDATTGYAQAYLSIGMTDWGDGADSTMRLYATLTDHSRVVFGAATGTIGVSVDGGATLTTATITHATAGAVQSAIAALANVGSGNVTATNIGSGVFEITFPPTLGTVTMSAGTNTTVGYNLGEQLVWESTTAGGVTADYTTPGNTNAPGDYICWLVPIVQLAWKPTERMRLTLRADFSGADLTGAYMVFNAGLIYRGSHNIRESSTTLSDNGYYTRGIFTGSSDQTWTVPNPDQFYDIPRRGDFMEYVNAGTATLTLSAPTARVRFRRNGTISTTLTVPPGKTVRYFSDGIYYNVIDGLSSGGGVSAGSALNFYTGD